MAVVPVLALGSGDTVDAPSHLIVEAEDVLHQQRKDSMQFLETKHMKSMKLVLRSHSIS